MEPFDYLHSLLKRLALVVMWLAFAVFHLALLACALAAAWFWQISPETASEFATSLFQQWRGASFLGILGFLGFSGGLALYWYVRMWRKIYGALVTPFLFRDIDRQTGT